jgi:hypothetical protein
VKLSRERTLRFNMGRYESIETSAGVEIDSSEIPEGIDSGDYMDDILDNLLTTDVEHASALTNTPEDETFVHNWKDRN